MIIRNLTKETLKFQSQEQIVSMPAFETVEVADEIVKAGLLATFGGRVEVVRLEEPKITKEELKVLDVPEDAEVITEEEAKELEKQAIVNVTTPEECEECYADGKTPAEEDCKNCDKKVVTEEAKEVVVAEVKEEEASTKTEEKVTVKKSASKGKNSQKKNK